MNEISKQGGEIVEPVDPVGDHNQVLRRTVGSGANARVTEECGTCGLSGQPDLLRQETCLLARTAAAIKGTGDRHDIFGWERRDTAAKEAYARASER